MLKRSFRLVVYPNTFNIHDSDTLIMDDLFKIIALSLNYNMY